MKSSRKSFMSSWSCDMSVSNLCVSGFVGVICFQRYFQRSSNAHPTLLPNCGIIVLKFGNLILSVPRNLRQRTSKIWQNLRFQPFSAFERWRALEAKNSKNLYLSVSAANSATSNASPYNNFFSGNEKKTELYLYNSTGKEYYF